MSTSLRRWTRRDPPEREGDREIIAFTSGNKTVTSLLIDGDQIALCHIGDSRAYRLRGDGTATVPPVQVAATPVAPGEQLPVTFATADGGSKQVSVPVVLDQAPYGSATADHPGSRTDESKPSAEGH